MDEGVGEKRCSTCKQWKPLAVFFGEEPGRVYATCLKCRGKFQAWYQGRGEPRLRHDRVQDRLSRATCLTCKLPPEVCRGQLNAGCIAQYAPLAQKGWQDGKDRNLAIPELEDSRLEAEPLAALPVGFETAGVARVRGSDRAGEVWMRLK